VFGKLGLIYFAISDYARILCQIVVAREGDIQPGKTIVNMHKIVGKDAENPKKVINYLISPAYDFQTKSTPKYSYCVGSLYFS